MKLPTAKKLPSGAWRVQVMVDGARVSVTDSALHDLVDTGLVGSTSPSWNDRMSGSVFLTGKGCLELLAEMDARQTHAKIADQEKEARDYRTRKEKREKLTLLLSVFSFIVSVCAIVISIIQP